MYIRVVIWAYIHIFKILYGLYKFDTIAYVMYIDIWYGPNGMNNLFYLVYLEY